MLGMGFLGKSLSVNKDMVDKGIRLDDFTYPAVLKAYSEKSASMRGRFRKIDVACRCLTK